MKDFMYLLITVILTGFAIGVAYLQTYHGGNWFLLFIPLAVMMVLWGTEITEKF